MDRVLPETPAGNKHRKKVSLNTNCNVTDFFISITKIESRCIYGHFGVLPELIQILMDFTMAHSNLSKNLDYPHSAALR